MVSLQDRIRLVRSEAERIGEFLRNLPAEKWAMPSACSEWQVADVLGHLTWVGEFYTNIHTRALQGVADPPDNSPAGSGNLWGSNDQFFAQTAINTRQRLGADLLDGFVQAYDGLFQLFDKLQPTDMDKPCYLPAGSRPLQYLPVMTIQELAIHSWDIRSGVEPSAKLSSEVLPTLMERISMRRLPDLGLGPDNPEPVRYRFELAAPSASVDYLVEDGRARLEPAGEVQPIGSYKCSTDTFVLMMYGRVKPDQVIGGVGS
jgi:uncharacterized protein (TIGR03083 family)